MAGSRVVHHGTGPARTIRTGIGPLPAEREKLRDRATVLPADLPRRAHNLDALLCLRGASTGDYQEALSALLARARRTCRRA